MGTPREEFEKELKRLGYVREDEPQNIDDAGRYSTFERKSNFYELRVYTGPTYWELVAARLMSEKQKRKILTASQRDNFDIKPLKTAHKQLRDYLNRKIAPKLKGELAEITDLTDLLKEK